jgi:hypothetical protein
MDWWNVKRPFVRFYANMKPVINDLAYDVPRAFKEVFYYFPRHTYRFIVKVFQYMPLLWRDEDWDWGFLMDMIQYKVSRMRKCIHNNAIISDADKVCKQMDEAVKLIDLIREDDWTKEEDKQHDEKWGESHMRSIPVPNSTSSLCKFLRYNVRTKEDEEQERKEYRKIMWLRVRRAKAAKHKLFKLLEDHLLEWWD